MISGLSVGRRWKGGRGGREWLVRILAGKRAIDGRKKGSRLGVISQNLDELQVSESRLRPSAAMGAAKVLDPERPLVA